MPSESQLQQYNLRKQGGFLQWKWNGFAQKCKNVQKNMYLWHSVPYSPIPAVYKSLIICVERHLPWLMNFAHSIAIWLPGCKSNWHQNHHLHQFAICILFMSMIINHHHRPQNATRDSDNQTVYSSVQEEVQQYVSGIQVIITTIINHHRHHDNHQCFWHTGSH